MLWRSDKPCGLPQSLEPYINTDTFIILAFCYAKLSKHTCMPSHLQMSLTGNLLFSFERESTFCCDSDRHNGTAYSRICRLAEWLRTLPTARSTTPAYNLLLLQLLVIWFTWFQFMSVHGACRQYFTFTTSWVEQIIILLPRSVAAQLGDRFPYSACGGHLSFVKSLQNHCLPWLRACHVTVSTVVFWFLPYQISYTFSWQSDFIDYAVCKDLRTSSMTLLSPTITLVAFGICSSLHWSLYYCFCGFPYNTNHMGIIYNNLDVEIFFSSHLWMYLNQCHLHQIILHL